MCMILAEMVGITTPQLCVWCVFRGGKHLNSCGSTSTIQMFVRVLTGIQISTSHIATSPTRSSAACPTQPRVVSHTVIQLRQFWGGECSVHVRLYRPEHMLLPIHFFQRCATSLLKLHRKLCVSRFRALRVLCRPRGLDVRQAPLFHADLTKRIGNTPTMYPASSLDTFSLRLPPLLSLLFSQPITLIHPATSLVI